MKTKPSIGLMVVMLMFPQIVETITALHLVILHCHSQSPICKQRKPYRSTLQHLQSESWFGVY